MIKLTPTNKLQKNSMRLRSHKGITKQEKFYTALLLYTVHVTLYTLQGTISLSAMQTSLLQYTVSLVLQQQLTWPNYFLGRLDQSQRQAGVPCQAW